MLPAILTELVPSIIDPSTAKRPLAEGALLVLSQMLISRVWLMLNGDNRPATYSVALALIFKVPF